MSDSTIDLPPDALFVVACPICQGHVAATGGLCGQDACCPLCASLFHVPFPTAAAIRVDAAGAASAAATVSALPSRTAPPPGGLGEDWGPVIETLAPPHHTRESGEPPTSIPPAGPDAAVADPPTPESLDVEPPTGDGGADPGKVVDPAPHPPGVVGGDDAPLPPAPTDLAFKEPVRTVRVGGEVIEIRRLTPEERRARRFRRNLLMIVIGISILLTIVVVAGFRGR